jgi:hypothetical protein
MRAAVAAAPRSDVAAPNTAELERQVLTQIARGGLLICETELRYQLQRHGVRANDLLGLLVDLEQQGLIESAMHYRLTEKGRKRLPARQRPAAPAISGIPWR